MSFTEVFSCANETYRTRTHVITLFRDRCGVYADAFMPLLLSRCSLFCSFVVTVPRSSAAELVGLSLPANIVAAMAADVSLLSGSFMVLTV